MKIFGKFFAGVALVCSMLALGGCTTFDNKLAAAAAVVNVSPTDQKVAKISDKLYKACTALELAGKMAAIYWQSATVATANVAITAYCQSDRVTSVATALAKVGQIYEAVKTANKAANVPLAE